MATVLLIEDDDLIRRATTRQLTRLGYKTVGFCDGSLAREFLRTSSEVIHLIVCDVKMPVMDGIEFYRWLSQFKPHLLNSFLFHSASHDVLDAHEDVKNVPRLDKPVEPKDFTAAVSALVKSREEERSSDSPSL